MARASWPVRISAITLKLSAIGEVFRQIKDTRRLTLWSLSGRRTRSGVAAGFGKRINGRQDRDARAGRSHMPDGIEAGASKHASSTSAPDRVGEVANRRAEPVTLPHAQNFAAFQV